MKKVLFIIGLLLSVLLARNAFAVAVDKITWCHVEPNGNQQTLELPLAALQNAGHVDANGNPLHAGDHAGACVAPSGVISPTQGISPTSIPVTPTPTEVTPTPTEEPSVTPTEAPKEGPKSDGLSQPPTNTTSAPSASCPIEIGKVDALNVETGVPNDNALEIYWTPISGADKVNIYYSEESGNWRYSVIGVEDNGHFQIGGLKNGQHYFVQIEGAQDGNCVGQKSAIVDPLP